MDPQATSSISEFAIVVAGFTGLVLAMESQNREVRPIVKVRAIAMLFYAFTAAFGSLIPTMVQSFGVLDLWRISSWLLVPLLIGNILATILCARLLLTVEERDQTKTWMWLLVIVGNLFFSTILVLTLLGFIGIPIEGAFFSGLIWQLVLSSIMFTRLIIML